MRRGVVLGGRYELDQPVGRGGMGEVWRAYDQMLDRRLAVKFISMRGKGPVEELMARFRHEARNTAWLEHPGVPTVYDLGEHDGSLYLVMQYVDGMTVDHLIDLHERLPAGWAALIAAQVCAVLCVAHRRPLVHRDLKPGNLMLCPDGSVKVLDFGVAVALAPGDVRATTTGAGPTGTVGYIGPEQMYGSPGPQSDLYSLGCVLYEMLTGRQVFTGGAPYEVMRRHEDETPEPPRGLEPEIPAELDALVVQLLAKKAADRPADAAEVYERLLPFVTGLGPLHGAVDLSASRTARMYAAALAHMPLPGTTPEPVPRPEPPAEPVTLPGHDEVAQARDEAGRLASTGRFTQAAELLSDLAEPAALALGDDDPGVIDLRLELADVLFQGGDHRRAAPAYRVAADGLAEWYGPDDHRVLHCREHEALCHAQLGETETAIGRLESLRPDLAAEGDRFRLRETIGRLRLAGGQVAQGRRELSRLRDELRARFGDDHPEVRRLGELLAEQR